MAQPDRTEPATRPRILGFFRIETVTPAIYGLIVSSAVMASASYEESAARVAIAVLVTLLVYWIAEQYAAVLSARLDGRPTTAAHIRASLRKGWPMVQASYAPLVVLLLAGLLGADAKVAVVIALIFTTVLLFGLGWLAGRRSGISGPGLLLSALLGGGLGVVMIVLKFALH
jgi:hypothetical protein